MGNLIFSKFLARLKNKMNYGDDGDVKHHVPKKTYLSDNRRAGMKRNP